MYTSDEDINMQARLQQGLRQLSEQENRRVFSAVAEGMFHGLYSEIAAQCAGLKQRLQEEAAALTVGPDIITTIIDKRIYDLTDDCLRPMQPDDLRLNEVDTAALLASLAGSQPFFLFTVFLQADYLDVRQFDQLERSFRGVLKTRHSEYTARFHVRRNRSYQRQIEKLYGIFQQNYLPWRSLCAPYLFKLFDVYIDGIDNWDNLEPIEEVVVDFEEYAASVRYHHIPLWNLQTVTVHTSVYPTPCIDKVNYEHQIFQQAFNRQARYLIANNDRQISNIRWVQNDLIITCPKRDTLDWEIYQCNPSTRRTYPHRLMTNCQSTADQANLHAGRPGQPIKTKRELNQLLQTYGYESDLRWIGLEHRANPFDKETYHVDGFMLDELRVGSWQTALCLDFQPMAGDSYLNRDIMSYLVSIIQRHFPEYECCGRLVAGEYR